MLAYRHGFHAGNHADVLKHLVLALALDYMTRKPAPITYIDTHAGAGRYRLDTGMAQKNREFESGVLRVDAAAMPEAYRVYHEVVAPCLARGEYPGSAAIAAALLRPADRLRLCELHPSDAAALGENFRADRRVTVEARDGFAALKAWLPAPAKRALVLIDPSYELASDFRAAGEAAALAWRRMPGVVLLLWYPVVQRHRTERMIRTLAASGVCDLWRYELAVAPDSAGRGMTASGILAINPPWVLAGQLAALLPALARSLAGKTGRTRLEQLVDERGADARRKR